MTKFKASGVIPPMITPFTKLGDIDERALREVVDFEAKHNDGIFPLGTYGSGPLMDIGNRKKAAEIIINQVNGQIPVIVHVGAASTKDTVELAQHAAKAGATAVASIVPFYYLWSENQLSEHFKAIINSVDIPVYIYNNPACGRNTVTPILLEKLADAGLAGIKDSAFDIGVFYDFQRNVTKPNFDFIIGTEALILPAFINGCQAVVSGVAIAFPEVIHELVDACKKKDWELAAKKQMLVRTVREIMHLAPSVSAIHAFLKMRGIDAGYPKQPFKLVDENTYSEMENRLIKKGLLKK